MKALLSTSSARHRAARPGSRPSAAVASDVPFDFVELTECLGPQNDRKLGYFGTSRFVAFRYEPRAEEVMWRDDRSFGIATGAWQAFFDDILPLAELYGVNAGNHGRAAQHMLVLDRIDHCAYFASRESAESFLQQRAELMAGL